MDALAWCCHGMEVGDVFCRTTHQVPDGRDLGRRQHACRTGVERMGRGRSSSSNHRPSDVSGLSTWRGYGRPDDDDETWPGLLLLTYPPPPMPTRLECTFSSR